MDYKEHFIEKLKGYRKRENLTQDDLADKIGYSTKAIAKWEQGLALPPIEILIELSKIMGMRIDDMLGLNDRVQQSVIRKNFDKYINQLEEKLSIKYDEFGTDVGAEFIVSNYADFEFMLLNISRFHLRKNETEINEGMEIGALDLQGWAGKYLLDNGYLQIFNNKIHVSKELLRESFDLHINDLYRRQSDAKIKISNLNKGKYSTIEEQIPNFKEQTIKFCEAEIEDCEKELEELKNNSWKYFKEE